MREKISVLYYPDFWVDYPTLVKAILLFDELHIMDRPSIMFDIGQGQFGTVGVASPVRQYEVSFRADGIPIFVHDAPGGPVYGEWYEDIKADVNDPEFLKRFQNGLKDSPVFRRLHIAPGNYGQFGDEQNVAKLLIGVDVLAEVAAHGGPIALFEDPAIRPFELSTSAGCAKQVVAAAVVCSAKLNFALKAGAKQGFVPLADAKPYSDLLGSKYARAINSLEAAKSKVQLADLSFAIFDELVPTEAVRKLNLRDVIRYRDESRTAREELLEHLSDIQHKQAAIGTDGDYSGAIEKLIATEIRPAVRNFRHKLETIDDTFYGTLAKGAIAAVSGSSLLNLFGGLAWPRLLALATAGAGCVVKANIDAFLAERAAKRECSISYILALEEGANR